MTVGTVMTVTAETARRIYGGLQANSESVRACEREGGKYHAWTTLKVDLSPLDVGVVDVDICKRCYVRRCTVIVHEGLVCLWPIEHGQKHMDELRYERALAGKAT